MSKYSLDVISHHPEFSGKTLKQYHVDQINTVGVWGNEPFEIIFKNNSFSKVQVKISIDGTDILTGQPANTEVTKDMWVVQPYGTLNIKAWPETQNGGAGLVFTSAENSVAIHTHGDMSCRGIIAAAVFVEGEPPKTYYNPYPFYYGYNWDWELGPVYGKGIGGTYGGTYNSSGVLRSNMNSLSGTASSDNITCSTNAAEMSVGQMRSSETLVAVGAGEHVEQKISYVQGLNKPLFTETVRIRYLWWDDLLSKLNTVPTPSPHASGFPGDKPQLMSLGSTPRLVTHTSLKRAQETKAPVYTRFLI
jgi:hypothetical protein